MAHSKRDDGYASERYAKSAAKQSAWWFNMSDEERAEYERKRAAGLQRYRDGQLALSRKETKG